MQKMFPQKKVYMYNYIYFNDYVGYTVHIVIVQALHTISSHTTELKSCLNLFHGHKIDEQLSTITYNFPLRKLTLTKQAMLPLCHLPGQSGWLNDELINSYLMLIAKKVHLNYVRHLYMYITLHMCTRNYI